MRNPSHKPPRWAEQLLQWYCKPNMFEDLHGDLLEYFHRNVEAKGLRYARIIFIIDVIKFFRSYTVRKPDFVNSLIHWVMIRSYIKSSGRNLLRHKLFSTINIAGLAISMSVGLLVIGMLSDLLSYDKFNENHHRIYRVISQYEYNGKKDENTFATTSLVASKAINESFTGVEAVATFSREFGGDFSFNETIVPLSGFWADPGVLKTFSFELLEGNREKALAEPFTMVLTERSAKKLFGNVSALGKHVLKNGREYTVTGVLKDIPKSSHIQFEVLGSLSGREVVENRQTPETWNDIWITWVYLLVEKGADLKSIQHSLDELAARENKKDKFTKIYPTLQPLDNIMTGENLNNNIGTVAGRTTVWIFSILAIVVIFSACLNYTNLSIARALKRTKEVGIRKTIGATRDHVVFQFITESILISLLALLVAFGIFLVIRTHFITVEPSFQTLLTLEVSPLMIGYFVVFAAAVGVLAGLLPALFFSKITPVRVLKGIGSLPSGKRINGRKVLIVFQFFLSIIGITVTIVAYKQYKHYLAYDLGFNTANVLNISLQGNKAHLVKKEIQEVAEVQDISESKLITSVGNYWGSMAKNPDEPNDSSGVYYNIVDERYLPLHNHKLIAGRNFIATADSLEKEVIVNESVVKHFHLSKGPVSDAIDKTFIVDKKPLRVIGVVKDFSYSPANADNAQNVVIRYSKSGANHLNVKILSTDWPSTYAKLEKVWKKIDPIHPFEAKFYDDQIEQNFAGLQASIKVAAFLSFLVICIASIGLLGMVVFTTETRIKEVSIRKVLGSTNLNLMVLLGRSFLFLVLIAGAIAVPTSYLFFDMVLLPNIPHAAPVNIFEMTVGFVVISLLAVVVIWTRVAKVVVQNPADVLKAE